MPAKIFEFPTEEQGSQNIIGRATGTALETFGFLMFLAPALATEVPKSVVGLAKKALTVSVKQESLDNFLPDYPDDDKAQKIKIKREKVEARITKVQN